MMTKVARAAVAAFLLVLPLAACNSDSLPPASQFTSMQGQILDSATNKPIAGAVITVDSVLTATTDQNGKFTIDKVPSGIVDYSIQAQGYKVVSASGNAEPGKPFELNMAIEAQPPG
jgi:hypothetical protein